MALRYIFGWCLWGYLLEEFLAAKYKVNSKTGGNHDKNYCIQKNGCHFLVIFEVIHR